MYEIQATMCGCQAGLNTQVKCDNFDNAYFNGYYVDNSSKGQHICSVGGRGRVSLHVFCKYYSLFLYM